jgi:Calcineurin-like phosphoesterase
MKFAIVFILVLSLSLITVNLVRAENPRHRIAFVGDIGTSKSGKATIYAILREKPNAVVLLGDMGYSSTSSSFGKLLKPLKSNGIQVLCNIGNHDSEEEEKDSKEEAYWKLCSPGQGFWNLKGGPLTIIGINTQCEGNPLFSKSNCNSNTIGNYLKGIKKNEFVLTTSHKPLCDTPKSNHPAYTCTPAILSEFKRLNVDADIGAHNHCMATDGKGNFISGAGGKSHYSCSGWAFTNSEDYGYLLLSVYKNKLDFVFKDQRNVEISKHYIR